MVKTLFAKVAEWWAHPFSVGVGMWGATHLKLRDAGDIPLFYRS